MPPLELAASGPEGLDALLAARLKESPPARYRRRRTVAPVDGAGSVRVRVNGRELTTFCSNDYLGLGNHPEIVAAFQAAAARYGVGSGASHLVTGHGPEHEALEEELAAFTGRARALVFSTGYMANLGIAAALMSPGDALFEDRLNHASLIDAGLASGSRFHRYPHADVAALERRMDRAARSFSGSSWIVTDGVFSMDGDIAPLTALSELGSKRGAHLIVDDAHGFGVLGHQGRGSIDAALLGPGSVPVLMGTFGKALGTFGAFVAGSETVVESLIQRARTYIYTTALPPAVAAATRVALRIAAAEDHRRERLHRHIARFKEGAAALDLNLLPSMTPIQPVLLGSDTAATEASEALGAQGILVSAIRPPTVPAGSARLRITFSAAHEDHDIDRLLAALAKLTRGRP